MRLGDLEVIWECDPEPEPFAEPQHVESEPELEPVQK